MKNVTDVVIWRMEFFVLDYWKFFVVDRLLRIDVEFSIMLRGCGIFLLSSRRWNADVVFVDHRNDVSF